MLWTPKPCEQKDNYKAEQAVSSTVIPSCKEGKRRKATPKARELASPSEWPLHTKNKSYCRDLSLETSHSFFQVLPLSLFGT